MQLRGQGIFWATALATLGACVRERKLSTPAAEGAGSQGDSPKAWKCLKGCTGRQAGCDGCPVIPPKTEFNDDKVVLVRAVEDTHPAIGRFRVKFYRNNAYKCGISGHYSFIVLESHSTLVNETRPLWVYEHGGGMGYWNSNGDYLSYKSITEDTYNHEETMKELVNQVLRAIIDKQGQAWDTTMMRRLKEGYRILAVSYCDHDAYIGQGSKRPNSPYGGQMNGLQASLAAVHYTLQHYPTDKYFLHGGSIGSTGIYYLALAISFAEWDHLPSGCISDSPSFTTRFLEMNARSDRESERFDWHPDFDINDLLDNAEPMLRQAESMTAPEHVLRTGFEMVPYMFIYGTNDNRCGHGLGRFPGAEREGVSNCKWLYGLLEQAAETTPHVVLGVPNGGHVPTVNALGESWSPEAHDAVDEFIRDK